MTQLADFASFRADSYLVVSSSIESSNEIQLTLVNPSVNVVYDIHEYWLIKNVEMKIESSLRKCSCREICGSDVAGDEKPAPGRGTLQLLRYFAAPVPHRRAERAGGRPRARGLGG